MVERIGGDLLLKLADRADRAGLLGDFERRARGRDGGVVALGLRHLGERLLGLLELVGRDIAAREAGERRDVGRRPRPGSARRSRPRPAVSPSASAASAAFSRSLVSSPPTLPLVTPLDEGHDLALRQRAHEAVGRLAVDEGDHRRDRLDAHLARDGRMVVDVHLDQLDLALGGLDDLFQDRGELLARAAPGRPEVDQHRLALRLLDHVLHEALGGGLLDETLGAAAAAAPPPFSSIVIVFLAWRPDRPGLPPASIVFPD